MAEQMNVEKPPHGQAGVLDAAAEAAAQAPPPVVGNPEAAAAIQESAAQAAQGQQPAAPQAVPGPPPGQESGEFAGITGIMQAPGVMQQPMTTPYERDQMVAMMWDVVAQDRGTALTQQIAHELTGVD